jgi:hypothetical protein
MQKAGNHGINGPGGGINLTCRFNRLPWRLGSGLPALFSFKHKVLNLCRWKAHMGRRTMTSRVSNSINYIQDSYGTLHNNDVFWRFADTTSSMQIGHSSVVELRSMPNEMRQIAIHSTNNLTRITYMHTKCSCNYKSEWWTKVISHTHTHTHKDVKHTCNIKINVLHVSASSFENPNEQFD